MEFQGCEKLRGSENWNVWKFAVRNLLRGVEGAYEICIGEIPRPKLLASVANNAVEKTAYETCLKAWDKADRAASQILVRVLESRVMALLVTCETAREIWLKLHSVFEQQTKQAAHTSQSEFFGFCWSKSDDIVTHIAKFEGLVLRMQQLNVKPDESSLMVKLLDTLPDDYESLRQAWWARPEELQTFSNLIQVLTSEENRRKQRAGKQEEMVALMASRFHKSQAKCERSGNETDGNQLVRKFVGSTAGKSKDRKLNFKCYGCGESGHIRKNCPS